jgi:hypothetical protein
LAWLGLAWLGLAWLGLAWLGLAWLGLANVAILHIYLPMKMERTGCSETSACKFQTPGNYPEESLQHTEHGESLESRIYHSYFREEIDGEQCYFSFGYSENILLYQSRRKL